MSSCGFNNKISWYLQLYVTQYQQARHRIRAAAHRYGHVHSMQLISNIWDLHFKPPLRQYVAQD